MSFTRDGKQVVIVDSITAGTTAIGKLAANAGVNIGTVDIASIDNAPPYADAPVVTVYSPSTTAYMKVTPDASNLKMHIAPREVTHTLVYAPNVTHKIADATTIAAADADDLAKSKTLIDEIVPECKTHIASTAYHLAAGTVLYPGHKAADTTNTSTADNMSSLATGYVLADELEADLIAHAALAASHIAVATIADLAGTPDSEALLVAKVNLIRTAMIAHFGATANHYVADVENVRLATATTPATNEGSAQTCINLLKTYWNSHCGVGAAAAADLAAVICHANAVRTGLLIHYASATTHGGTADATNLATLTAVPAASDLATAQTLITAEKATLNLHYAVLDGGLYVAVPLAGLPLEWNCLGSVWVKTDQSAGVFTTSEWRSA